MEPRNLLEYSDSYSITLGNMWNYYRDVVNDNANEIVANYRINNKKTTASRSFEYNTKIIGNTPGNIDKLYTEVIVSLKFLNNFDLDLLFFNSEIELDLSWSRNCVISEISRTAAVAVDPNANPPDQATEATERESAKFRSFIAKLYVPVVTLSINDNIKFLENIKQGFKRTSSYNTSQKQQFVLYD